VTDFEVNMNRPALLDYIKDNRLYFDGAMGSMLIERGFDTAEAERLNLTHPEVIEDIHTQYLQTGSKLIYTNTFGANSIKQKQEDLSAIITAAVENATRAARPFGAYVAYDVGPLGKMIYPYSDMNWEQAYEYFAEQARIIRDKNLDCVVIETIADLAEMRAAYLAFRENTDFPIFCSMTFEENKRSFFGTHIKAFALTMQAMGADAIGINCSIGPDKMEPLAEELIKYAYKPIFIKPNAGLPELKEGRAYYSIGPEEFCGYMEKIADKGIGMLGGCCGTTPDYIRELVARTSVARSVLFNNRADGVCSAFQCVDFDRHIKIGERVNPTGKPLLQKAIAENDFDAIFDICAQQVEEGAEILDINVGMPNIDEKETLTSLIQSLQSVCRAPLQIDSASPDAIEAALRAYNGVAIINSVTADEYSMSRILPLAAKYGAYLIVLPLDKGGIPASAEGRAEKAGLILNKAAEYGIPKERIIADGLTMAASADKDAAATTLKTLRLLKSELGVKTVIGLSNISFGLCCREIINATFYAMALEEGLDFAIVNPKLSPELDPYAYEGLMGGDKNWQKYINKYQGLPQEKRDKNAIGIYECILQGQGKIGLALVKKELQKSDFNTVINEHIIPALNELGERFDKKSIFLPQLIAGADAASAMLNLIKEKNFVQADGQVMLVATVEGDIHDIGKNIAKVVISNYGYHIIDLGKDVPVSDILSAIEKYRPSCLGLSALMTTTMNNMKKAIQQVRAVYPSLTILVGGAVLSEEFARSLGDGIFYCKNPQAAIGVLAKLKEGKTVC
jgi:5-methyltetrahydrofolate--homocysteine methyltransferase